MANLAASGVTKTAEYYVLGGNSKRYVQKELTIVLSSMGTTTNQISAAVLGFSKIVGCSPLIASDNTLIVVGAPNYTGTLLLLKAAGTNAPADATGTFKLSVYGNT